MTPTIMAPKDQQELGASAPSAELLAALEAAGAALEAFHGYDAEITFAAIWKWLGQRQAATDLVRAAISKATGGEA